MRGPEAWSSTRGTPAASRVPRKCVPLGSRRYPGHIDQTTTPSSSTPLRSSSATAEEVWRRVIALRCSEEPLREDPDIPDQVHPVELAAGLHQDPLAIGHIDPVVVEAWLGNSSPPHSMGDRSGIEVSDQDPPSPSACPEDSDQSVDVLGRGDHAHRSVGLAAYASPATTPRLARIGSHHCEARLTHQASCARGCPHTTARRRGVVDWPGASRTVPPCGRARGCPRCRRASAPGLDQQGVGVVAGVVHQVGRDGERTDRQRHPVARNPLGWISMPAEEKKADAASSFDASSPMKTGTWGETWPIKP